MRNSIRAVKVRSTCDYNYNHNDSHESNHSKQRIHIDSNIDTTRYFIRIGFTGKFYIKRDEISHYKDMGVKIHKEE